MLGRVRDGKGSFGDKAATGGYGDLIEMGILDPAKFTCLALQYAASVAGLARYFCSRTSASAMAAAAR